jgi:hypothetical protein
MTPRAIWDNQAGYWVSDAEAAEIPYTAFTSKKTKLQVTARLIVRRVRTVNKKAAQRQDELFPVWRCHAVFTDPPFATLRAEDQHHDRPRPGNHGQDAQEVSGGTPIPTPTCENPSLRQEPIQKSAGGFRLRPPRTTAANFAPVLRGLGVAAPGHFCQYLLVIDFERGYDQGRRGSGPRSA